ncbi:MAG: pilus assembly protein PilZ [Sphingomonadales bacterium 32-64-17]|nr:MAG: pilus assembly protein PilZ [Sphingomonadales bacterium 32-64-17]
MSLQNRSDIYYLAAQEDRSAERVQLMIPAQLRVPGARAFQTVVKDISLSGFAATAINRMHPGSLCWLSLPDLETQQAEVIWWEDALVGCAFVNLLSPIVHDTILARYRGEKIPRGS